MKPPARVGDRIIPHCGGGNIRECALSSSPEERVKSSGGRTQNTSACRRARRWPDPTISPARASLLLPNKIVAVIIQITCVLSIIAGPTGISLGIQRTGLDLPEARSCCRRPRACKARERHVCAHGSPGRTPGRRGSRELSCGVSAAYQGPPNGRH